MLWDGGFDFAFASYTEFQEIGTPVDDLQSFLANELLRVFTVWKCLVISNGNPRERITLTA
jgi:hypothetical protein